MKIIYFLIFVVISGCVTQRRCAERFPCVSGRDSIHIEKLIPISIAIPGHSLNFETKIPCNDFELRVQNDKLIASLKVVNGILQAKLNEKPDTFIKYVPKIEERIKEVTVPVKDRYVPKFVKIMAFVGGVCVLLILFWLLMKFKVF
jgi:hypothetical protein